jgi:hypothetical protein
VQNEDKGRKSFAEIVRAAADAGGAEAIADAVNRLADEAADKYAKVRVAPPPEPSIAGEQYPSVNDWYMRKNAAESMGVGVHDMVCAKCGRDDRNGTHAALEVTGHLGHEFKPVTPEEYLARRRHPAGRKLEEWGDEG